MDWTKLGISFGAACGLIACVVVGVWVYCWLEKHAAGWVFGVVAALMVFTALFYITTP